MADVAQTASDMISGMAPKLRAGAFVFVTTNDAALIARLTGDAISIFRENEGVSLILPVEVARDAGFNTDQSMRCITLNVYSSLDGVGLTSAVSSALGEHAIPCNMVAAFHHDHVFVPSDMCDRAMEILASLQSDAIKGI
jgi:hypothetical protein